MSVGLTELVVLLEVVESLKDGVINLVEDFVSFVEVLTGFGITVVVVGLVLELVVTMVTTVDVIEEDNTRLVDVTATGVVEGVKLALMAVSDTGNEVAYKLDSVSVTIEESGAELGTGILEDVVATEVTTVELISMLIL